MFLYDFQLVAALVFSFMGVTWLIYLLERNPSIIDVGWSLSIGCGSLALFVLAKHVGIRQLMVVILTLLWSTRITIFLLTRVAHGKVDLKYVILSKDWGSLTGFRFFCLFFLQGCVAIAVMTPIIFIYSDANTPWRIADSIALVWFLVSFAGELIADYSLLVFRTYKENNDTLYDRGVWRYSRHPNYFFEINIWLSIALFATSAHPYGYLGFLSPLLLTVLLVFVTGVPLEEKRLEEVFGPQFHEYKRKTSLLIPWLPKK